MSVATAIDTDDIAREMAEVGRRARAAVHELAPVSYTHLTLPTILRV